MEVREYGSDGPWVVVLHGGPGVAGQMGPVARGLKDSYRVLEPFQRGSGEEPLTVARHVADLHEITEPLDRPALVGSSWGAMLALAYAASHPLCAGPLGLVGCGTFDLAARARLEEVLAARMDGEVSARLARLEMDLADPDERLARMGELVEPLFVYSGIPGELEHSSCDARAHEETWADALRLQAEGVHPAAFLAIESPVLMLHGAYDPHPGAMIRDSLAPWLGSLVYVEWEKCGHYPWAEREVREEFFTLLREWLAENS